jgi:ABC-type multidrug transport system permease subunit
MITTIVNLLILFVATVAILIFMLVFGFFVFIMFACTYIGWQEIKAMPVSEMWRRLNK